MSGFPTDCTDLPVPSPVFSVKRHFVHQGDEKHVDGGASLLGKLYLLLSLA